MNGIGKNFGWFGLVGRPRRVAVVDFDGRGLRIIQVNRVGVRPRLRKFHSAQIPAQLDINDPRGLGEFLAATLKKSKLAHLPVIMNVPRGQAVLKPLCLPPGTARDEIAGMVQFQVQGELPFPIEEAVLDFTVEGESSGPDQPEGLNVLAAAVRRPVLDFYRDLAAAAGVKLLRLGLRPYANARCIEACSACGEGEMTAVVHITADETEISVIEGDRLTFSRSAVLKVPPAERMTTTMQHEITESVAAEVVRSLQGFSAVQHGSVVGRILVAGACGIEAGVAEMLRQLMDLRCELFNPAEALKLKGISDAGGFISLIGLAFGSRGTGQAPFDFLHPKRPVVKRDPRRQRRLAIVLAAMLALFAVVGGSWYYLNAKSRTLNSLRGQKNAELKKRKAMERLIARVETVDEWVAGGVDWLDHWLVVSSLMPGARDVYIDELRTSSATRNITVRTAEGKVAEQKMKGSFTFTVRVPDSKIIEKLVHDLQQDGYTVQTGKDGQDDNPYGYIRHTEVRLFIPPDKRVDITARKSPARPKDDDIDLPLGRKSDRPRGGEEGGQ